MLPAMKERIVSDLNTKDPALDTSLRPDTFADFVGQDKIKERLCLAV